MKKTSIGIFVGALLLVTSSLSAFAANHVNTIDIGAVVYPDGSMYITQTWDGDFTEGTENYIPMNAPDYLTISDLKVTDINGTYETVENWNVDWSLEEKANKCGINYTNSGYEICFGIGEYGKNRYAIEYKLNNVVGGYSDMDGVNFRFVNDRMNTAPTDVKVQINLSDGTPITDEMADIWAFGFEGQVGFSNGAIIAYSEKPITVDNHVTIMFGLNKGVCSPTRQSNDSFETVKQAAFDGSDYDNGSEVSIFEIIITIIVCFVIPIIIVIVSIKLSKKAKQKELNKIFTEFGYFRDIPNEGNLSATYALGRLFNICNDGAILATGMLRLIDLRCLVPVSNEVVGVMGRIKETVNLQLAGINNSSLNEYDEYLYTILEGAAGSDGILQAKELEIFADKHDKLLRDYISKRENAGKSYLSQKHCLTRFDNPSKVKYLTQTGKKEFGELIGFKKYLEDFSLIAERGVKEMPIWKELLSYAMLFGIADKVALQMKELYPNIEAEVASYSQNLSTAYAYQYVLYNNMKNGEARREQAKRSSGSGGFSSIGGGGGSIGGGTGGGSR